MSKKIISAILSIAMIVSMFATAFVTSVGAAAETTYEADRAALKAAIQEIYLKGVTLDSDTINFLKDTGILTWDGDNKRYVEEYKRSQVFGTATPDLSYFVRGNAELFVTENYGSDKVSDVSLVAGKVIWDKTLDTTNEITYDGLVMANVSNIVEYAASVYYFAQNENDENVDASFNEGRNEAVKAATSMINTLLGKLKAEVKSDVKPSAYSDVFNGAYYKGFASLSAAYNQSIGVNPYYNGSIIGEGLTGDYFTDSYYLSVLGQYPVKWFTFDEIRAKDTTADLLFAFEVALRDMALNNGAGVLYYDFKTTTYAEFNKTFSDLCDALIGDITVNFETVSIDDQIKSFEKLMKVIDVYELYSKDLYNNIYTATNASLLSNVLYAKQIISYVTAESTQNRLLAILMFNVEDITNNILSAIKSNVPRNEQLLTAANIADGTALVNKAASLLKAWANWEGQDNKYGKQFSALKSDMNILKNMLPASAGADVLYTVAADSVKIKNWQGTEIGNDKFTLTFTPNYFAYIKYYALLEAQINNFIALVNAVDGELGAADLSDSKKALLIKTVNKYGYLFGIVGNIINPDTGAFIKFEDAGSRKMSTCIYSFYLFEDAMVDIHDTHEVEAECPECGEIIGAVDVDNFTTFYAYLVALLQRGTCAAAGHFDFINGQVKISSIYESVVGYSYNVPEDVDDRRDVAFDINYDAAIDNVYNLFSVYLAALGYYNAPDSNDVESAFDWTNSSWTYKSKFGNHVDSIIKALGYLTKDLTVIINTYAYKMDEIADFFGWIEYEFEQYYEVSTLDYDALKALIEALLAGEAEFPVLDDDFEPTYDTDGNLITDSLATILNDSITLNKTVYLKASPDHWLGIKVAVTSGNATISFVSFTGSHHNFETNWKLDVTLNADLTMDDERLLNNLIAGLLMNYLEWRETYPTHAFSSIFSIWDEEELDWMAEDYQNAANYPKDVMKNAIAACNALQQLIDNSYDTTDNHSGNYIRPTNTSIIAAYENFIAKVKVLLTDDGAAALDKFINAVDKAVKEFYGKVRSDGTMRFDNAYDDLYAKLEASHEEVDNYVGTGSAAAQPYLHFAYRLSYVMSKNYSANRYSLNNGRIDENLYNPIKSHLGTLDVTGYARDWSKDYEAARNLGKAVNDVIDALRTDANKSDMPLWYALRVLDNLNAVKAEGDKNTVTALAAYKADLNALIAEASEKNVYEYVTSTDEASAIWNAFVAAFNAAQKVQYDARESKDNIDAAYAALAAAMADLEKIAAPEGAATADTLNAKIADAEALVARADITTAAAKAALVEAIYAAKKVMQFNINVMNSTEIQAEVKTLDNAMNALSRTMYLGANLKKDIKVFEMKVVKALYTEVSYNMFANACTDGYAVAANETLKESEYEAARAKVEAKFNGLKEAPVVEEPDEPAVVEPAESEIRKQAIEVYNDLAAEYATLSGYTAESLANLKAALNTLKASIEANADDATLIENIIAAKLARAAIVIDNPTTCDD